jgi:hypothetical protein
MAGVHMGIIAYWLTHGSENSHATNAIKLTCHDRATLVECYFIYI